MQKKDIQLLLIVFGILIAFASWQFIYKGNQEKTEKIQAENVTLQATVNELEVLEAQKEQFVADTETMKQECTNITNSFASGILAEDEIMYLYNMELVDANDVKVPSVTMGEATEIPYSNAVSATTEQTVETIDGETGTDGAAAVVTTQTTGQTAQFQPVDEGIRMYDSKSTVAFTTTYGGLKNIVKYVYEIPARKAISSVNLTASEKGYLSGTMELDFYCLTGTEVPYSTISIPGVPLGTDNIFGVLNGAQSESVQEGENEAENAD